MCPSSLCGQSGAGAPKSLLFAPHVHSIHRKLLFDSNILCNMSKSSIRKTSNAALVTFIIPSIGRDTLPRHLIYLGPRPITRIMESYCSDGRISKTCPQPEVKQ